MGVLGTIFTFVIISTLGYLVNIVELTISELLLFSSVLASTDTVTALTLIKQEKFPRLNSILFGEGIMNDAVCILLFRSILAYTNIPNFTLSLKVIAYFTLEFIYLLFASLFVGLFIGFVICFLLKKVSTLKEYPVKETSLIMLVGYISYLVSESLNLSGIISLFSCAVIIGHYGYNSLS